MTEQPSELKRLRYQEQIPEAHYHSADLDRLVQIFRDRGYEVGRTDLQHAWSHHCEGECCASWYSPAGSDDFIFNACMQHLYEM